eukprot:2245266-Alexandrium_andersonii.AAC.1
MSASLVGSEMCIRDRKSADREREGGRWHTRAPRLSAARVPCGADFKASARPVLLGRAQSEPGLCEHFRGLVGGASAAAE